MIVLPKNLLMVLSMRSIEGFVVGKQLFDLLYFMIKKSPVAATARAVRKIPNYSGLAAFRADSFINPSYHRPPVLCKQKY